MILMRRLLHATHENARSGILDELSMIERILSLTNVSIDEESTSVRCEPAIYHVSKRRFHSPSVTDAAVDLNRIQIGCSQWQNCAKIGWKIVDAIESIGTHFVSPAWNLSMIDTGSVDLLYASHILEHLSHTARLPHIATDDPLYGLSEMGTALMEWRRVLALNGSLMVAVPDFMTLAWLLIDPQRTKDEKRMLMTIFYGGQEYEYNFHKVGFFHEYLQDVLTAAGFCNVTRVDSFGHFNDTSEMTLYDKKLSLNMLASAC